jgi:hypothetical protein
MEYLLDPEVIEQKAEEWRNLSNDARNKWLKKERKITRSLQILSSADA